MYVYLSISICSFLAACYFQSSIFVIFSAFFSGYTWAYFWLYFSNQNKKTPEISTFSVDPQFLASVSERMNGDCEREQKK